MPQIYAEGGNFRIELEDACAYCRVWTRPDVDSTVGAGYAREKVTHFDALARGPANRMIFDLSAAPPVAGPKTQESLGGMLAIWERVRRPIAVVAGENQVQLLQLRRLVAEYAPSCGAVFSDVSAARTWVAAFK
jgi:hypothetical protein